MNNIALVNGRPQLLNLKQLIHHFVEHRHDVIIRRSRFDLQKAEKRLHIVNGLLIAQDNIDEVVHIIRSSKTSEEARVRLQERFSFSELQTAAILEMRLRQLVGLQREQLEAERDELIKTIDYLNAVLANVDMQMQIIKDELLEIWQELLFSLGSTVAAKLM